MNTKAKQEGPVSEAPQIASETMVGDLMQLVIDELKAAPDVWQKLGERWQRDIIERSRPRSAYRWLHHPDAQQDRNGIATVIDGMRGYPHKRGFSAIPHAGDQHRPLPLTQMRT